MVELDGSGRRAILRETSQEDLLLTIHSYSRYIISMHSIPLILSKI